MWNNFTATVALTIDNDQRGLNRTLGIVSSAQKDVDVLVEKHHNDNPEMAVLIEVSEQMKFLYGGAVMGIVPKNSFSGQLSQAVLNEAMSLVNWRQLAIHYMEKVKKGA